MPPYRNGKAFNARIPVEVHRAIKAEAARLAEKNGGQSNMNKLIVKVLYDQYRDQLTESERTDVERYISRL